jgi:FKBP-type peptidyl-prolyl cis-trans isomerase FklB
VTKQALIARSLAFGALSAYKSPVVQGRLVLESAADGFSECSVHHGYLRRLEMDLKSLQKLCFSCTLIVVFSLGLLVNLCLSEEKPQVSDPKYKDSYSLGFQFGDSLKKQKLEINTEVMVQAIHDAMAGKEPQLSEEEMKTTLGDMRKKVMAAQQKAMEEQGAKNLAEGKAFLAENGKKEGVVTLPSGLQYKVLKDGTGKTPQATDSVTVHYRGTLMDGTEFDSSYSRNNPSTFKVSAVIAGWTEALQLMKEGAKWQLFIPAELAYKERGMPPRIAPNSPLIFEVELISVNSGTPGITPQK